MAVFNKKKFLKGVEKGKYKISDASKSLRDDEEVALLCAKHDKTGDVFPNLTRRLRNSPEFIKELLAANGLELKNLKYEDRNNEDLVLIATKKSSQAIYSASVRLRQSKDFLTKLVSQNAFILRDLEFGFDKDEDLTSIALDTNSLVYRYIHKDFKQRYDFALKGVQGNSYVYNFLLPKFQENKEIILTSLRHSDSFTYCLYRDKIPERFREDEDVSMCACESNINCINCIPTNLFRQRNFQMKLITYIENTSEEMMASGEESDIESAREFELKAKNLFLDRRDRMSEELKEESAKDAATHYTKEDEIESITTSTIYDENM